MFGSRKKTQSRRTCPHVHLQGIYGDAILASRGYRLQCTDCWSMLEGPVELASVNRDPNNVMPQQDDWFQGKEIG